MRASALVLVFHAVCAWNPSIQNNGFLQLDPYLAEASEKKRFVQKPASSIKVDPKVVVSSEWKNLGLKASGAVTRDLAEKLGESDLLQKPFEHPEGRQLPPYEGNGVQIHFFEKEAGCRGEPEKLVVPEMECVEGSDGKYYKGTCDVKLYGHLKGAMGIYNDTECKGDPLYYSMVYAVQENQCVSTVMDYADFTFVCGSPASTLSSAVAIAISAVMMLWSRS